MIGKRSRNGCRECRRSAQSRPAWPAPRITLPALPQFADMERSDEIAITHYFQHHLRKVGLGDEFVDDGNSKVLCLLHEYPDIIGDVVFALGHTRMAHVDSTSLVPALACKSRALTRLRSSHGAEGDIEPLLLLALGLGAVELIDTTVVPETSAIPSLLAYASHLVSNGLRLPRPLGDLAKYFLRALTRQDIIFSLTHRRRNLLPTSTWFDASCLDGVDRFLGLTMPLMPLLEELCALAEDMTAERRRDRESRAWLLDGGSCASAGELSLLSVPAGTQEEEKEEERVQSLGERIRTWRPVISDRSTSFLDSRKYLLQAHAFRSAALLYLHRLCHPAGPPSWTTPAADDNGDDGDDAAVNMAYEVLLSCQGADADVRMILWPLLVAGCEMRSGADRRLVLDLLDRNYRGRGTYTALRTRDFLLRWAWPAMDAGEGAERDWMSLVGDFASDFAPL